MFNGKMKAVTFSYDDGVTQDKRLIELFNKYGVKATFFVGGDWVAKNSQYLTKIVERGHEIGNHGYFHKDHKKLSYEENLEEINNCSKLVKSFTGYDMKLFASAVKYFK